MGGALTRRLGVTAAAAAAAVTASAFTLGVDSAAGVATYGYTATGLPAGAKTILFFVWADTGNRRINAFTVDGASATSVTGPIGANTSVTSAYAVFAKTDVTATSCVVSLTFNSTVAGCVVGHVVLTGTTATAPGSVSLLKQGGAPLTTDAMAAASGGITFAMYSGSAANAITFTADAGTPTTLADAASASGGIRYGVALNTNSAGTTITASSGGGTELLLGFTWNPATTVPIVDALSAAVNIFTSTNTKTFALTTNEVNEIIRVIVASEKSSTLINVSSVTAAGLTFTKRGDANASISGRNNNVLEIWDAPSTGKLSALNITVTMGANIDSAAILAFGVIGCGSLASPYDPSVSAPVFTTSTVSTVRPTAPVITTSNALDLLMAGGLVNDGANDSMSSWPRLADFNNGNGSLWAQGSAFSKPVSAPQSSLSTPFAAGSDWTMIRWADAFKGS